MFEKIDVAGNPDWDALEHDVVQRIRILRATWAGLPRRNLATRSAKTWFCPAAFSWRSSAQA